MKKVAIFTAPEGHHSLSKAAESALDKTFAVCTTLIRDNLFGLYTPFYQYIPSATKVPFMISSVKPVQKYLKQFGHKKYDPAVTKVMKKDKPDIAIATHFMYLPALEKAKAEKKVPLLNILSDPWTIHPLLVAENADLNVAFDSISVQAVQKSAPQAKVESIGWLVQPQFQPVAKPGKLRKKLSLEPDVFTVVFSAGSEGTIGILNFVPSLLQLDTPCQFVVLCGNNKQLVRTIKTISRAIKRVNKKVSVHGVPFVTNVHEYYAAADLVAGKAGPNTIFEAVACHKPFLATTHVRGQEDGNLALIEHYGLGYVEENLFKAAQLLTKLIRQPELLESLQPSIQKMAKYNSLSGKKLLEQVRKLTK